MNKKVEQIFNFLQKEFPEPKCELNYNTTFQLLCAVILSAQCTDKRVNIVTQNLFQKYPDAQSMSQAEVDDIEKIIHSCGFYHNKAKSLKEMSTDLCENHKGQVPSDFDSLIKLRGVGRKTANVVLAEGFKQNELGVDTHIFRVSHRLGLSNSNTPEKVEMDLRQILKGRKLNLDHYFLVLFGRYICKAQKPDCKKCELKNICSHFNKL